LKVNRLFGETYYLHLQGLRKSQAGNQREVGGKQFLLLLSGFFLGLQVEPEDEGDVFLRSVGRLSTDYTALYPRRQNSS
jgi:hypothetical protein